MRKKFLASLGLGVVLSGLGLGGNVYAQVKQAPIDITVQKLYYENKDDVNYKQEASVISPTQVWDKVQYGDVAFTLYKVDSALIGDISPMKVAGEVQEAVAKGESLPYGAVKYKEQVSIDEKGIANFSEVEVGASYVVVETVHSSKVEMDAKPVFLKVDAEKPGNIKVYLKNKAPKPEEPQKPEEPKKLEEPKKQKYLSNTGLVGESVMMILGSALLFFTVAGLVFFRMRKNDNKEVK